MPSARATSMLVRCIWQTRRNWSSVTLLRITDKSHLRVDIGNLLPDGGGQRPPMPLIAVVLQSIDGVVDAFEAVLMQGIGV